MTTPTNPIKILACPTCGAPLDIKLDEPTIKCQFCNSLIENPEYHQPQPVEPLPQNNIQFRQPIVQPVSRPISKSAKRGLGCTVAFWIAFALVMIAVMVISVGGISLSAILGKSGLSVGPIFPIHLYSPSMMLNPDGGDPNFISFTYDPSSETYGISRVNLASKKILWTALAQKDSNRADAWIASSTMLYLAVEDRLIALQLTDGKQAWVATLPDKLDCKTCIQYAKGQVVALSTDYSLGAYDAQTGHQTWEKHLDSTNGPLSKVGDSVALAYSGKQGSILSLFDATSGDEIVHLVPTCEVDESLSDNFEFYNNIIYDTTTQPARAYTFYGLFNACVQAWDLSSGKMIWEYKEKDQNLDNYRDNPILMADGTLYYVQDTQLRSIDTATGRQMKVLEDNKDYDLIPLFVQGQRLIVRAKRSTGSARFELWGYDLDSGKNLWKYPILKSSPLEPPDAAMGMISSDESAFSLLRNGSELWLTVFQASPNQANISQVNLDTGELSNQKTLDLGIDKSQDDYDIPEPIKSFDNLAWYNMGTDIYGIYALDPKTGAFTYRYP